MPRAKESDTVVWAQPISGGYDPVQVPEVCGPSPEFLRIRSQSHTGRSYKSRHSWKPPQVRAPKPPPSRLRSDVEEEQLLYVALYRDKIAQHQSQLAQGQEPRIRYGRPTKAGISDGAVSPPSRPRAPEEAPLPPLALPELALPRGGARAGRDDDEPASAGRRASTSARRRGGPQRSGAQSARAHPASADIRAGEVHHVAAVRAIPAYGGVSTEHAETKQLGKLFDMWYAQKEQERELPASGSKPGSLDGRHAGGMSGAASHPASPGNGTAAAAATGSSAATAAGAAAGTESGTTSTNPRRMRSSPYGPSGPAAADAVGRSMALKSFTVAGVEAEDELEEQEGASSSLAAKDNPNLFECGLCGDFIPKRYAEQLGATGSSWASGTAGFGASLGLGSSLGGVGIGSGNAGVGAGIAGDAQGPPKSVEQVRTERLYNVITNRKVPFESFGERGASEGMSRREPTHVEGFPTLNLMRLYQGLWRLEI